MGESNTTSRPGSQCVVLLAQEHELPGGALDLPADLAIVYAAGHLFPLVVPAIPGNTMIAGFGITRSPASHAPAAAVVYIHGHRPARPGVGDGVCYRRAMLERRRDSRDDLKPIRPPGVGSFGPRRCVDIAGALVWDVVVTAHGHVQRSRSCGGDIETGLAPGSLLDLMNLPVLVDAYACPVDGAAAVRNLNVERGGSA